MATPTRNKPLIGNALIGQSGGPTAVINSSLVGILEGCLKSKNIKHVYGMRYAIQGTLDGHFLDLGKLSAAERKLLAETPGSALGSSRLKLKDELLPPILENLKKFNIRYLFMIGGNDSMDTIRRVVNYANAQGYEMVGVGCPKTVDNDLYGTDHTPGYASAARYVALSLQQGGRLNSDMQKVDQFTVLQTVGRSSGWLPAAGAAARRAGKAGAGDAPHIILMPERAFDKAAFLAKVKATHEKFGFVSVVTGEGVCYKDGTPLSASETKDKFGNTEFGAMGGTSAAISLHRMISEAFGWRGEFQILESLQMCAQDRAVAVDRKEAHLCGQKAVAQAMTGKGGVMITLLRKKGAKYAPDFGTISLEEVANIDHGHSREKPVPAEFITADGMDVTPAFMKYISPLVGEMPKHLVLDGKAAKPAKK